MRAKNKKLFLENYISLLEHDRVPTKWFYFCAFLVDIFLSYITNVLKCCYSYKLFLFCLSNIFFVLFYLVSLYFPYLNLSLDLFHIQFNFFNEIFLIWIEIYFWHIFHQLKVFCQSPLLWIHISWFDLSIYLSICSYLSIYLSLCSYLSIYLFKYIHYPTISVYATITSVSIFLTHLMFMDRPLWL